MELGVWVRIGIGRRIFGGWHLWISSILGLKIGLEFELVLALEFW